MRILITGGGGQLGQDCADRLQDVHQVTTCTSSELDITSAEQVKTVFTHNTPEVVINCGAYTAVDRCEKEQKQCRAVNSTGAKILARQCAASGCRLIHISTDYVFDGNKKIPEPYRENDPTNPLSVYGQSKLDGEQAIADELKNHLIIRTAWLYGMGSANFLKTMLRLTTSDPSRTIQVVKDQFGSLTWTKRLAEQIDTLLESNLTGIVHATAKGYSNWYEGAIFFLNAMGIPAEIVPCTSAEYPTPAHRPANSILENSRLNRAGLNVMRPWQEDVELFVQENREQLLRELNPENQNHQSGRK